MGGGGGVLGLGGGGRGEGVGLVCLPARPWVVAFPEWLRRRQAVDAVRRRHGLKHTTTHTSHHGDLLSRAAPRRAARAYIDLNGRRETVCEKWTRDKVKQNNDLTLRGGC